MLWYLPARRLTGKRTLKGENNTQHTLTTLYKASSLSRPPVLRPGIQKYWAAVLHFRWNLKKWDYKLWRVRSWGLPCHLLHNPIFQSPASLQDLCASGFYCHSFISLFHYSARQGWFPEQSWNVPKWLCRQQVPVQHLQKDRESPALPAWGQGAVGEDTPASSSSRLLQPGPDPSFPKPSPSSTETSAAQKIKQQQVSLLLKGDVLFSSSPVTSSIQCMLPLHIQMLILARTTMIHDSRALPSLKVKTWLSIITLKLRESQK